MVFFFFYKNSFTIFQNLSPACLENLIRPVSGWATYGTMGISPLASLSTLFAFFFQNHYQQCHVYAPSFRQTWHIMRTPV